MAMLKDSVVSGSLRVTDTTYTNDLIIGASKTKNWFLGTPSSADGTPTFRALVAADIPTLSITDKTSGTLTVARGGTGLTTASYKNAIITGNGTTVTNAFTVVRTGSGALYATAQDGAAVFGTLPVAQGGTGLTTASYKNAIITGNGTTANSAFTVVRTASGALYATAQDGAASFGTLPVAQGGTGATSFTANSLIMSGNTTTAALTTRAIYDRTSVNALNAAATWANSTSIPTLNTLTYWDGRYQTTNNLSNLTYLNKRVNFPTITGGTGVTAADNGSGTSPRYRPASWKFNASITPVDGDVVTVKKPSALHDYGTWLSLDNGTTWYPIVYANTSRLPDWFSNNYSITLRFDAVGTCSVFGAIDSTNKVMLATDARSTITGVWRLWTMYDTGNSNDTGTLVRDYGGNVAIVSTVGTTYRYQILLSILDTGNNGWKVIPVNTTSNSTGTGKTNLYTGEFNPFGDIYYYNHTDTVSGTTSAPVTMRADRIWKSYPVDIRYSFNCGTTLTASKDVYMVAYLTGNCKAKLRNPGATGNNASATATGTSAGPLTQVLPTTADGYIYIKIGKAYSTYQVDIALNHPIYYHDGNSIQLLAQTASYGTTLPANGREGQTFFQVSDPWYELPPGGTSGQVLTKASNNDRDVSWASPTSAGVSEIANMIYPVGSIYMSVNSTDPSTLFGGTWERLKDRFLLSAGDSYTAGNTGGEATHKLTTTEMPSHTHSLSSHTHSLQSHTHTGPSHAHEATSGGSFVTHVSSGMGGYAGTAANNFGIKATSTSTAAGGTGNTGGPSNNTSGTPSNNTSGSSGSDGAHNNMPPYLVVYMWKRTA